MYYGEGFTHTDLYTMPIYLRNFYYKHLLKVKKQEMKDTKKAQQKNKSIAKPNIPRFKR
jgi:hypothetical protein|tara:strand:+ start:94 stop:270 length:177 start_codon:yes stop_codon:yes gene_type:complete